MDDYNLKLILKNELKYKMTSHMFKKILQESGIRNKTLEKNESIDLLFEECSLYQIKDLILNEYESKQDFKNYQRLINRINGLTVDERNAIERKKEKKKRGKALISPSAHFDLSIDDFLYEEDYIQAFLDYYR